MRLLVLILVGIVVGPIATVNFSKLVYQRYTHKPCPTNSALSGALSSLHMCTARKGATHAH